MFGRRSCLECEIEEERKHQWHSDRGKKPECKGNPEVSGQQIEHIVGADGILANVYSNSRDCKDALSWKSLVENTYDLEEDGYALNCRSAANVISNSVGVFVDTRVLDNLAEPGFATRNLSIDMTCDNSW